MYCVCEQIKYNVRFQFSYVWLWKILSCIYVTIDGAWIGKLDLLTTCTHHSELHVITALLLISTLYKSKHAKSLLACSASKGRSQATTSNSADSSASCVHVIPVRRKFRNWTHSTGLGSSLYSLGGTQQKTLPPTLFYCCYGRLPSDSLDIVDMFTSWYRATRVPCHDHCTDTHYKTLFWNALTCSPADIFLTFQGNILSPSSGYKSKCGKSDTYKGGLEHTALSIRERRTVEELWSLQWPLTRAWILASCHPLPYSCYCHM
jgi:hypothetical protein